MEPISGPVEFTASNANEAVFQKDKNDVLGKDDFLKLIIAQLRYQDPTNPMDNAEFVAQTAQLTSLEQLTNLNNSFDNAFTSQMLGQASALIGHQIFVDGVNSAGEQETFVGIVDYVKIKDGKPMLAVGDKFVDFEDVKEVYDKVDINSVTDFLGGNSVLNDTINQSSSNGSDEGDTISKLKDFVNSLLDDLDGDSSTDTESKLSELKEFASGLLEDLTGEDSNSVIEGLKDKYEVLKNDFSDELGSHLDKLKDIF